MKGAGPLTKVHYRGKNDDFVIYVENVEAVQQWKNDKSVPLSQVINGWKIFCTHKQGAQGILDAASHASLDSEFGSHNEEEVVKQILEKGDVQETKGSGKEGDRNPTNGPGISNLTGSGVHN